MMYYQVLISGLILLLPAAVGSFPEVHAVVGHPVTLPCSYPVSNGISSVIWGRGECTSDTSGQTFIWTDGYKIYYLTNNHYQLKGQLLQGNASLTIESVAESDSGLYCCRVETKGSDGVRRLTFSLQVQPEGPTSSSRRPTISSRFKLINGPRPTPRKPGAIPKKHITVLRKPTTIARRQSIATNLTTTSRRPLIQRKPTTTPRRLSTTTKPTTTPRRPPTTRKPTTTPRRPSTTTKSTTTSRRPITTPRRPATTTKPITTTMKPTTTPRTPSTTIKFTTTPIRPSTTTKIITTSRRPSTIPKSTATPSRPTTSIKPSTTSRKPETTTKPTTTSRISTTTTQHTIISTGPTDLPKPTRISPSTLPTSTHMQTPKPAWTDTVTSSHHPWSDHTEVAPAEHPLKILTKGFYIGISVFAALLILAIIPTIIYCRHLRKKKKRPESSVVLQVHQNEAYESTVCPQAKDIVYIIEDGFHSRIKSRSEMKSFQSCGRK